MRNNIFHTVILYTVFLLWRTYKILQIVIPDSIMQYKHNICYRRVLYRMNNIMLYRLGARYRDDVDCLLEK